jgi:(R,R)-butanediol dehydrogenase / meso-butanediol dehydrogenase / diacetyl reductase
MKAVRFHGQRDIRVEEISGPSSPLALDEVLIKPMVCGICGTDLHEYVSGPIVTPIEPHVYSGATNPQILGHEFSAVVLDVGRGVKHVSPGDRISVQPLVSPRDDYFGRRGLFHVSPSMACIGLSWAWGGMGQLAVIKGDNAIPVSKKVSDVQAAVMEPGAVALYALDRGRVHVGSTVLISGLGPIGALVLLGAKASGASKIFVAEVNPNRLAKARELVPDCITVNPLKTNLLEFIKDQTEEGVGVDAAIECGGSEASLNACVDAVRRQGIVVQAGLHSKQASVDPMKWALKDITIEATWCFPVQSFPRVASMIESGIFPVEKIVTAQIAMDDVVEKGFEALLDPTGNQMKILVNVN